MIFLFQKAVENQCFCAQIDLPKVRGNHPEGTFHKNVSTNTQTQQQWATHPHRHQPAPTAPPSLMTFQQRKTCQNGGKALTLFTHPFSILTSQQNLTTNHMHTYMMMITQWTRFHLPTPIPDRPRSMCPLCPKLAKEPRWSRSDDLPQCLFLFVPGQTVWSVYEATASTGLTDRHAPRISKLDANGCH